MDLMTKQLLMKLEQWIEQDKIVRFYQSKEWRKIRAVTLRMYGSRCQQCGKKATMVHHKEAVRKRPELALRLSNLEPECKVCHNKEHPEKLAKFHKKIFENEERW
ncbi:HNH endonuclease [Enterococcus sp. BWM-S5]|uniref:Putative HNH nuclease YajD n=1 Tax=Enterococcus larvae TaxID=2794352 RepID=A0ABS4CGY4_9ENTE|nr:HNH endonuclease [Enterococcus larvae]MBP1045280.1 HNH endonuclease [Enterococcus larvae]